MPSQESNQPSPPVHIPAVMQMMQPQQSGTQFSHVYVPLNLILLLEQQQQYASPGTGPDVLFNLPYIGDPTFTFGSEAANMEYSSLSALLGLDVYSPEQDFQYGTTNVQPPSEFSGQQQFASREWPESPGSGISGVTTGTRPDGMVLSQTPGLDGIYGSVPALFGGPSTGMQQGDVSQQSQQNVGQQASMDVVSNSYPSPGMQYQSMRQNSQQSVQQSQAQQQLTQSFQSRRPTPITPKTLQSQISNSSNVTTTAGTSPGTTLSQNMNNSVSSLVSPPSSDSNSPADTGIASTSTSANNAKVGGQKSGEGSLMDSKAHLSYISVTKAYDYTESYHFLMKFLPKRLVVRVHVLVGFRLLNCFSQVREKRHFACRSCACNISTVINSSTNAVVGRG